MLPSEFKKNAHKKASSYAKISNSLVESFVKKNNLGALKILFYLSKHCQDVPLKDNLVTVKINVSSLVKTCNMDVKTFKRNLKQMQETSLTFVSDTLKGVSPTYEEWITVIPYIKWNYNGFVEVQMFSKILKLVVGINNKFTVIDIENLMSLRSKHSVRMIQLLEMIEGFSDVVAKRKTYSLVDLNSMFGTNYKNMYEFERKILVPTKKELDEVSKLTFLYEITFDKLVSARGRPNAVGVTLDLLSNKQRQLKLF